MPPNQPIYSNLGTTEAMQAKHMSTTQPPSQPSSPGSKQTSGLEKQWKTTQILASFCCFLSFFVSARAFWNSNYRNCDNVNPYGQSYRAGLYSGCMCVFVHAFSYGTLSASKTVSGNVSLTVEAQQRRTIRMPVIVRAAAFVQVVAAAMNALAAYRTSRVPLGLGHVPLVAMAAAYASFPGCAYKDV